MNFDNNGGGGEGISGNSSNQSRDDISRQPQHDEAQGNEKKRRVEGVDISTMAMNPTLSQCKLLERD